MARGQIRKSLQLCWCRATSHNTMLAPATAKVSWKVVLNRLDGVKLFSDTLEGLLAKLSCLQTELSWTTALLNDSSALAPIALYRAGPGGRAQYPVHLPTPQHATSCCLWSDLEKTNSMNSFFRFSASFFRFSAKFEIFPPNLDSWTCKLQKTLKSHLHSL